LTDSTFCLLPPGVALDHLLPAGDHLVLETHSTNRSAICPVCEQPSAHLSTANEVPAHRAK
jgi:hypothetical protein